MADRESFVAKARHTFHKLYFGHRLSETDAGALGQELVQNTAGPVLTLDSRMSAKSSALIAEALKNNSTVTELNWGLGLRMSDVGVAAIAQALKVNTFISTVRLSRRLTVAQAGALAAAVEHSRSLRTLDLSGLVFVEEACGELCRAIRSCVSLEVLGSVFFLEELLWLPRMVAITVAEAAMGNDGLHTLDLSGNELGDEGAVAIATLLKANTSLDSLLLRDTGLALRAAFALAEALRVNVALGTLDLSQNDLHNEGVAALAAALQSNTVLRALHVDLSTVSDEAAVLLAGALVSRTQ